MAFPLLQGHAVLSTISAWKKNILLWTYLYAFRALWLIEPHFEFIECLQTRDYSNLSLHQAPLWMSETSLTVHNDKWCRSTRWNQYHPLAAIVHIAINTSPWHVNSSRETDTGGFKKVYRALNRLTVCSVHVICMRIIYLIHYSGWMLASM